MKIDQKLMTPDILDTTIHQYQDFIDRLTEYSDIVPDISKIRSNHNFESATLAAGLVFRTQIESINSALADEDRAIIAVDIVESDQLTATENAFWGVMTALSIGSNVFHLSTDRTNDTPFTLYAASYERSQELEARGLATVAPETKLGFHTDGVINGGTVAMPHNILPYNLTINYQKPGDFHWVPFSLWRDKAIFMKKIGVGTNYRLKVTPSVYEVNGRLESPFPTEVEVPIFLNSESLNFPLYLNGNVLGARNNPTFDLSIIEDLKRSLSHSDVLFSIPQKTRRMIVACNLKGAHARDVFEIPIPDVKYTRLFMRTVDTNVVDLNTK